MTTNVIILNQGPRPVEVDVLQVGIDGVKSIVQRIPLEPNKFSTPVCLYKGQTIEVVEVDRELS